VAKDSKGPEARSPVVKNERKQPRGLGRGGWGQRAPRDWQRNLGDPWGGWNPTPVGKT